MIYYFSTTSIGNYINIANFCTKLIFPKFTWSWYSTLTMYFWRLNRIVLNGSALFVWLWRTFSHNVFSLTWYQLSGHEMGSDTNKIGRHHYNLTGHLAFQPAMDLSSSLSFWEESVCHCYFCSLVLLPFNFLPWFLLFMFNVLIFLPGLYDRNLDHYFCTLPFVVNKPSMLTPSPMGENTNDKIMKMQFYKEECSDILCTILPLCDSSWIIWVLCVFLCACTCVFWSSWDSVIPTYITDIYLWLPQCGFWVWGKLPGVTHAISTLRNLHLHVIHYCPVLLVCSLWHLSSAVFAYYSYQITR